MFRRGQRPMISVQRRRRGARRAACHNHAAKVGSSRCPSLVVGDSTGTFYSQAMTAGDIYTAAGDSRHGISGDGGPAIDAELAAAGLAGGGPGRQPC
jgi:hypothetical protein